MRSILLFSTLFFAIHGMSGDFHSDITLKRYIRSYADYFSKNPEASQDTPFDEPQIKQGYLARTVYKWLQHTQHPGLGISAQNLVLVAFIYLKRLGSYPVTSKNIINLTIIAIIIATKYGSDYMYHDKYYASLRKVSPPLLNDWQRSFLKALDYRLFVTPEELEEARQALMTKVARRD